MRRTIACIVAFAALAAPAAADATTIVVNTTEALSTTQCGLANAITAANTNGVSGGCTGGSSGGPDRIEFALPPQATIMLGAALPTIGGQLEIVGPGAEQLIVSGGDAFRVFTVNAVDASISDLTIADGKAESGGGVRNESGSSLGLVDVTLRGNLATGSGPFVVGGGAIWNRGALALTESLVSENVASSGETARGGGIMNQAGAMTIARSTVDSNEAASPIGAYGGGILNAAQLTLRDSTVSRNRASASVVPGFEASGGGVYVEGSGAAAIERSTISGNSVTGSEFEFGGGFASTSTATQSISASTLFANSADHASNVFNISQVTFRNTILAKPLGGLNCWVPAISLGFNLEEGDSCEFMQLGDQRNVDPLLAPGLAANGGPTETVALLPGSPALDRGLAARGESADQRSLRRPVLIAGIPTPPGGDGADVGAYELQAPRASIVRGPGEGETIRNPEPSFEFVADEAGAGFRCALDGAAPVPCASPYTLPRLADGQHTFSVGAIGANGYGQPAVTRSFTVDARVPRAEPSPPPSPAAAPPAAETKPVAPDTLISGLAAKTAARRLNIRFSSNQAGSTFSCKLDAKPWRSCRSPFKTPQLALGKHTFQVKATGPAGQPDATPAKRSFRVIAPPRGG